MVKMSRTYSWNIKHPSCYGLYNIVKSGGEAAVTAWPFDCRRVDVEAARMPLTLDYTYGRTNLWFTSLFTSIL